MSSQVRWSLGILAAAIILAVLMVAVRPEPVEEERIEEVPLVQTIPFATASGGILVTATGTVEPIEEVVVAAQVSGRINYVDPAFREGNVVSSGATLFRIEASDFVNQIRIAKADVAAKKVGVIQAQEEVRIASDELRRFEQRSNEIGAAERSAGSDIDTTRFLAPRSAEDARSIASEGNKSRLEISELATGKPQLESAQAAEQQAKATLELANLSLARTHVKSPFRGLVREESAAIGGLVQNGQTLGSIVSIDAYQIRLSLNQREAALIPGLLQGNRQSMRASVLYEFNGQVFRWPAIVDRADAILDDATRNIEVFLRVPAPLNSGKPVAEEADASSLKAPPLLLGAFVSVEMPGTSNESFAAIPAAALRLGSEVWVVRDGKLRILPVRVIHRSNNTAYVTTQSLSEGGQLVISSLNAPTDGMPVRVSGRRSQ